jgi:hypothetical protein
MTDSKTVGCRERRHVVLAGMSALVGVLAWGVSLETGYALVKWACRRHDAYILAAIPTVALAAVGGAAFVGWRSFTTARAIAGARGGRNSGYFVAQVAVGLNVLLAIMILIWVVLPFMVSPCE